LAIARRNCSNNSDAEEALHDAFLFFIRHFEPDGEAPPLAWLTLTLKRECWRRQKTERSKSKQTENKEAVAVSEKVIDPRRLPDEIAEARERVLEAKKLLMQLKENERRALWLFAVGYSYREIQQLTGWSYTRVNRCITEGRAGLRWRCWN